MSQKIEKIGSPQSHSIKSKSANAKVTWAFILEDVLSHVGRLDTHRRLVTPRQVRLKIVRLHSYSSILEKSGWKCEKMSIEQSILKSAGGPLCTSSAATVHLKIPQSAPPRRDAKGMDLLLWEVNSYQQTFCSDSHVDNKVRHFFLFSSLRAHQSWVSKLSLKSTLPREVSLPANDSPKLCVAFF